MTADGLRMADCPAVRTPAYAVITLVALLGATLPALADRDLVYSARYYTLAGSRKTSHFHLYRSNPNGTSRTGVTSGPRDDIDPQWSPDGNRIAFVRLFYELKNADASYAMLCVVSAGGGRVSQLNR